MFKNLSIYRVTTGLPEFSDELHEALEAMPFTPGTATQEKSVGWVPPRGNAHDPLVECVHGQWVMRFMVETRQVPGSVVQRRVDEMVANIETTTGRKPGKKERRDLKEEAMVALLPQAFVRQQTTWVWLDRSFGCLVLDTTSKTVTDDILTALVKVLDGFGAVSLNVATSPTMAMATWLAEQDAPAGFYIGRDCELKSVDESQAKVRYSNHPLMLEEVKAHIAQGKQPTRLALVWNERVSFVLCHNLQLKKVVFASSIQEQTTAQNHHADAFDGNLLIAAGELRPLIGNLVEALGGEA